MGVRSDAPFDGGIVLLKGRTQDGTKLIVHPTNRPKVGTECKKRNRKEKEDNSATDSAECFRQAALVLLGLPTIFDRLRNICGHTPQVM